jgi:hypothetical protein
LLTHSAGTRRSPHREASIEKQFRDLRIPGNWVTRASPSSIVIGKRPCLGDPNQSVVGHDAERGRAGFDVEQEVRTGGYLNAV